MGVILVSRVVARSLAVAGAVSVGLLLGACAGDDSFGRELRADAAAIQADKDRIDHDIAIGSPTALMKDRHRLYVDTEKQEHDRGTEDDELAEGEFTF